MQVLLYGSPDHRLDSKLQLFEAVHAYYIALFKHCQLCNFILSIFPNRYHIVFFPFLFFFLFLFLSNEICIERAKRLCLLPNHFFVFKTLYR